MGQTCGKFRTKFKESYIENKKKRSSWAARVRFYATLCHDSLKCRIANFKKAGRPRCAGKLTDGSLKNRIYFQEGGL